MIYVSVSIAYVATVLGAVAWHYVDKRYEEKPPLLQQLFGKGNGGDDE